MSEPTVEEISLPGREKYPYEGFISKDIFLRAQYLHIGSRRFIVFFFPVGFSIFIWTVLMPQSSFFAKILATAASFIFVPLMFLIQRWQLTQLYKKTPYFQESFRGVVSEQGIAGESSAGQVNLVWQKIIKHKKTDDLILLYQAPNLFNIVAKEFFATSEDWDNVRQLFFSQMKSN
jgi:hypothetical protein